MHNMALNRNIITMKNFENLYKKTSIKQDLKITSNNFFNKFCYIISSSISRLLRLTCNWALKLQNQGNSVEILRRDFWIFTSTTTPAMLPMSVVATGITWRMLVPSTPTSTTIPTTTTTIMSGALLRPSPAQDNSSRHLSRISDTIAVDAESIASFIYGFFSFIPKYRMHNKVSK